MRSERTQPWIHSATLDGAFILAPAFVVTALVLAFPGVFGRDSEIPLWVWALLIVGIDVSHVYSTLFRTYFDSDEFRARRTLYTLVPLLGWTFGVLLYSTDAMVFWRVLAYLAVFHFVRQQYGFLMLYARRERDTSRVERWLDKAAIYLATLYPLVYWHTHLPRNFAWYLDGDFVRIPWLALDRALFCGYVLVLVAYAGKELRRGLARGEWNLPKNLILFGTAMSWYVGIVVCNGDLAFTVTNVVSHGVPYMALVWVYARRRAQANPGTLRVPLFTSRLRMPLLGVAGFLGVLLVLAYIEEGFWDGLVWRDHTVLFAWFARLPQLADHATLAWVVPLLALPQVTHYVLDGFIWRLRGTHSEWKTIGLHAHA